MNIYVNAVRKAVSNDKIEVKTFDIFRMPANDAYEIIGSIDPVQAYIDLVIEQHYKNLLCTGESISQYKKHAQEFQAWVEELENEGFNILFKVI